MQLQSGFVLLLLGAFGAARNKETKFTIPSTTFDDVSITFKEVPAGICGTGTSYSGYVNFPPNSMKEVGHDYPVHSFFWYFKAQNNPETAPLVIWMNGGPGGASIFGLFTENGPCRINSDLQPEENEWSWNQHYNVLYVDQPVQTGFSYDVVTEALLDLETGNIIPTENNEPAEGDATHIPGKFGSQNPKFTANTTENAGRQFWNFLQVWTQDFPPYDSSDDSISIWTESYGGRYGPGFSGYILQQNSRIAEGLLDDAVILNLETLGVINGCVDLLVQETADPEFAFDRNTYGIQGITEEEYEGALVKWMQKDGCEDKILDCLHIADALDPGMHGNVTEVNDVCEEASNYCQNGIELPYMSRKQWAFYDITHCYLDGYPGNEYLYYLATEEVRDALGVPVNMTDVANVVGSAFNSTGDYARRDPRGYLEDIGYLLDSGVQVAMIHGDRDFACNWIGGERVSLGIEYLRSGGFRSAGYTDVVTDDPEPVGQVRQHGSFSFTRVYQSGHMVPSYQPKTAFNILERAMNHKDIATGNTTADSNYSTEGSFRSETTFPQPPVPPYKCYLRGMASTCADNQIQAIKNGSAVIENGVIIEPAAPTDACPIPPRTSKGKLHSNLKGGKMAFQGILEEL
ncbi:carboxypeptidase S1 [Hypoxylon sp. NC1633]|nr:carboxypeptidase S1 [Hypoxylon sp. NC1633]